MNDKDILRVDYESIFLLFLICIISITGVSVIIMLLVNTYETGGQPFESHGLPETIVVKPETIVVNPLSPKSLADKTGTPAKPNPGGSESNDLDSMRTRLKEIAGTLEKVNEGRQRIIDEQVRLSKKLETELQKSKLLIETELQQGIQPVVGKPCSQSTSVADCGRNLYCRPKRGILSPKKFICKDKRIVGNDEKCDEAIGYFCNANQKCENKRCVKK